MLKNLNSHRSDVDHLLLECPCMLTAENIMKCSLGCFANLFHQNGHPRESSMMLHTPFSHLALALSADQFNNSVKVFHDSPQQIMTVHGLGLNGTIQLFFP